MTSTEQLLPRRRMQALMAAATALLVGGIVGRFRTGSAILMLLCFIVLAGVALSPEFALGFAILAQTNFLGLVDPELLSIPGLFKISDIAFVLLLVPLVEDLATRRFQIERLRTAFLAPVALIIGVALFNIFLSNLREGVPLSLGFRIGRRYVFYALFFVAYYALTEPRRLEWMMRGCRLAGVISALVVMAVFFTGSEWLSAGMVTGEYPTAAEFTRPYSPAFPLIILAFFDSLAHTLASRGRTHWLTVAALGVTAGGILVDLSRNGWMAVIVGSGAMWWVMRRGGLFPRWRATRLAFGGLVALAVLGVFAAQFTGRGLGDALQVFGDRFVSTFADVGQMRGTFGQRIDILTTRMHLMSEEPTTFIWGLGFATTQVRAIDLALAAEVGMGDFTLLGGENGVATILAELGVLGLIAVAWFSWLVIKRGLWLGTRARDPRGRTLGPALAACHLSFVVQFLSLSSLSFAYSPYVMATALLMAMIERQYRFSLAALAAAPLPGAGRSR